VAVGTIAQKNIAPYSTVDKKFDLFNPKDDKDDDDAKRTT